MLFDQFKFYTIHKSPTYKELIYKLHHGFKNLPPIPGYLQFNKKNLRSKVSEDSNWKTTCRYLYKAKSPKTAPEAPT
jgi:hypothetical protein